jgi:hypothetical protein
MNRPIAGNEASLINFDAGGFTVNSCIPGVNCEVGGGSGGKFTGFGPKTKAKADAVWGAVTLRVSTYYGRRRQPFSAIGIISRWRSPIIVSPETDN